jgi:hypothetical protein
MLPYVLAGAFAGSTLAQEELEPIERETATKFASRLSELAGRIEKPQVNIDAEPDKAVGLHRPRRAGVLVVPQKDLKEENADNEATKAAVKSENGAPLGYLFLYRIVPVHEDKPISTEKLRAVELTDDEGNVRPVTALLLSVKNVGEDDWRLLIFGADKKPIVDAKFVEGKGNGDLPVGIQVTDVKDNEGTVVITVFDKYQAKFRAAYQGE